MGADREGVKKELGGNDGNLSYNWAEAKSSSGVFHSNSQMSEDVGAIPFTSTTKGVFFS